jgi:hypothetical protein
LIALQESTMMQKDRVQPVIAKSALPVNTTQQQDRRLLLLVKIVPLDGIPLKSLLAQVHLVKSVLQDSTNQLQVKMTVIQMYVFAPPLVVQRQPVKTVQRMVQINVLAVLLGKNLPTVALAILVQAVHIRIKTVTRAQAVNIAPRGFVLQQHLLAVQRAPPVCTKPPTHLVVLLVSTVQQGIRLQRTLPLVRNALLVSFKHRATQPLLGVLIGQPARRVKKPAHPPPLLIVSALPVQPESIKIRMDSLVLLVTFVQLVHRLFLQMQHVPIVSVEGINQTTMPHLQLVLLGQPAMSVTMAQHPLLQ